MKSRVRDWASVRSVAIVCVLALATVVSACGNGTVSPTISSPTTVITLSVGTAPDGSTVLPNTTKTVALASGQTFAVQSTQGGGPGYWHQTSGGNGAVLAQDRVVTVNSCPTDLIGCGLTTQQLYLAQSAGTSTIVWTYSGLGPGLRAPPSQPTVPCSAGSDTNTARCPVGVIRITVTVT